MVGKDNSDFKQSRQHISRKSLLCCTLFMGVFHKLQKILGMQHNQSFAFSCWE